VRLVVLALLAACEPPPADPIEPPDAARAAPDDVRESVRAAGLHVVGPKRCVVTEDDDRGTTTWVHTFDHAGRIVSSVMESPSSPRQMRHWARSRAGEVVIRRFAEVDGRWIEGWRIDETWEGGRIVARDPWDEKWTWDEAGRVVAYEGVGGESFVTRTWSWDASGRLTGSRSTTTAFGYGESAEGWSWDGDRLLGWSRQWNGDGSSHSELIWTAHDDHGLPLVGQGSRVSSNSGESTPNTRRWTEEWAWDELGRAVSHRVDDEEHEPSEVLWTWSDHDVLRSDGELYVWDDAGRVIAFESPHVGFDRMEWDWAEDGHLVETRYMTSAATRVARWSADCPSSSWFWVLEVPNPGPWPPDVPTPRGYGPYDP
jgi:hypothetical protein